MVRNEQRDIGGQGLAAGAVSHRCELHPDVAWTYADPIPDVREIAGLVCFYDDKVDLTVD
jgi:uncharacterized protein (DUF427 family)